MNNVILVLNAGSATLKFKLFDRHHLDQALLAGTVERIGLPRPFSMIGTQRKYYRSIAHHEQALRIVFRYLASAGQDISVIGHRVVHGGTEFRQPIVVSPKVINHLSQYNSLAPLHNPANLAVIKACRRLWPDSTNVAVFDTSFFSQLPKDYALYAVPYEWYERYGVQRYGFHGISHQYVSQSAAERLHKPLKKINLITAHLGNGCSISALHGGRPIATSMGFTPLEGLVMGTRPGDLDPGIPIYMLKKLRLSPDGISSILNYQSGLLGLSGFSSDMREILKAAGLPVTHYEGRSSFTSMQRNRARITFKVFISRLQDYFLYYSALLNRVDAVVFTGGIGERSSFIRQQALRRVPSLRGVRSMVIPTDEEYIIAQTVNHIV